MKKHLLPLPLGTARNSARWLALSLKIGGAALLFAGALLDWRLSSE